MRFFIQIVRKYPLSLLCVLLIGVLSLAPYFPETPLDDVAFIDKWTHLVMYGGTCTVIWWEYLRSHSLQAYCTTTRSGEWLDFWADSIGVLLGYAIGLLMNVCYFHIR